MSYFYSHIIKLDSLVLALEELQLDEDHKHHLSSLADATIHKSILTLILDQLSAEDKATFVSMLEKNPRDPEILKFLNSKVDKIEEQIEKAVHQLRDELHEDVKEIKKR